MKSGHVETLRAKSWSVEKDHRGCIGNIIPDEVIGRDCRFLDLDEVVLITVEEVADAPADPQPPDDGRRREDPAAR